MEFRTNKKTGTHSSNGKYNYAVKLGPQYMQIDLFFFSPSRHLCAQPDEIPEAWQQERGMREDTLCSIWTM